MARISKSPEERKQEIIETALILFSEKGYENTTIQDIAEKMQVAQGLCYRYFKSKQEIFAASSDFYARKAVAGMQSSAGRHDSAMDKFNAVIRSLLTYAEKNSEFEASFKKEPEISAERLLRMGVHISDTMIPIVRQGREEGVFQCEEIENTVRILTFGIINLIHVNMPGQEVKEHIRSFIPAVKNVCRRVLETDDPLLGEGWE